MKIKKQYPFLSPDYKLGDICRLPNCEGNFEVVRYISCDTCSLYNNPLSCKLTIPCKSDCQFKKI